MKIFKSIKTKWVFSIIFMLLVISTTLLAGSYFTYKNSMNKEYAKMGDNIAKTSISLLEEYPIDKYVNGVENLSAKEVMENEEYHEIIALLRKIKQSNDILYLYMTVPKEKGAYYVFDTDDSDEACPYGYFMEYYDGEFSKQADEFLKGEFVKPIISDKEYGWIISISYPYISNNNFLGYICVDISMDDVVKERQLYLQQSLLIMIIITTIFAIIYIFVLNKQMVVPIKKMSEATKEFVSAKDDKNSQTTLSLIEVHTGDELEQLCEALKQMEKDINFYIDDLCKVTSEKERIGTELNVATHIQLSMLPCIFPAFPDRDEIDIYATMTPAKEVGGDFYDFFMVDERHLAIVVADVSGKGVPAALFMVIGKTLIKDHTQPNRDLGEVFTKVNNILCEANDNGMFITAFEGVLDLVTGEFRYVNAGHEPPFIYRKGVGFEVYKTRPGFVLAGMENIKYKEQKIMLNVGDRIFQYTDGVTEAMNKQEQLYGMDRLNAVLNEKCIESDANETLKLVKNDIDLFVGDNEQFDDITMLCLEYKRKMGDNSMNEITVEATVENISKVTDFVDDILDNVNCPLKVKIQMDIAIDEIFGNIAHYAYGDKVGKATVRIEEYDNPKAIGITFIDSGVAYNPLEKEDPDITLSAEEREIGGLGIYMVKKNMDTMEYEYSQGQNKLLIKKYID